MSRPTEVIMEKVSTAMTTLGLFYCNSARSCRVMMQTCCHAGTRRSKRWFGDLSNFPATMPQRIQYLRHDSIVKEVSLTRHVDELQWASEGLVCWGRRHFNTLFYILDNRVCLRLYTQNRVISTCVRDAVKCFTLYCKNNWIVWILGCFANCLWRLAL